jgi:deazaflavin-dependent oxidoreductase (nitroreductase family)
MWFMNNIVNPLMRLILNSPLHGMMSAGLLLITYRGRKSGKEYTLPVQYAQDGKKIYIIPGMPEQKTWWRNLKGGLPVRLTLRGQVVKGIGIVLEQPGDAAEILAAAELSLKRSAQLAKMYNVRIEADGSLNADDLRKAVEKIIITRVDLA